MPNRVGALAIASYRGVEFYVESDKVETGRRLVVHQFPHRDTPYVEDMGRDANKISVTAYVANADAESRSRDLRRACESGGAATLRLPVDTFEAHCEKCTRDFAKDRLGYIAFSLSFVREGTAAAPTPIAYLARMVTVAARDAVEPLTALAAARMRTIGLPGYVADAAADAIRDAASAIDGVRATLSLDAAAAPAAARLVQDIYDSAVELSAVGEIGNRHMGTAYLATQRSASPAPLVAAITGAVAAVRAAAPDQREAAAELDALALFAPAPATTAVVTPSRVQEQANAATIGIIVRVAALAERAIALVETEHADRRSAIAARASIAAAIEAEMSGLAGSADHPVYVALADIRNRAIEHLTRAAADMAPVVAVSTVDLMPSLWWANALYGDAARAGEIAARNRVIHPSFMPADIEVLAR